MFKIITLSSYNNIYTCPNKHKTKIGYHHYLIEIVVDNMQQYKHSFNTIDNKAKNCIDVLSSLFCHKRLLIFY